MSRREQVTDEVMRWRVRRVEGAPVVAIRVWLRGGSRCEPIPGLAQIAGRMLAEGTELRDRHRVSREAAERGCTLLSGAGHSVQALAFDGLSRDWRLMLDWSAELLGLASFLEDRCRALCKQGIAELRGLEDLPDVVTARAFAAQLYPDHPLGRPLLGSVESLATIDEAECRGFHARCLEGDPLIAIAGAVDPAAVLLRLGALFPKSVAGDANLGVVAEVEAPRDRFRRVAVPTDRQAHICVGAQTVRRADPDFEAVRVLGVVLGAGEGLVGRLPARIRETEGLAYDCSVTTIAGAGLDPGRFMVSLATAPGAIDRARTAIHEELDRLRRQGPSAEEVADARSFLLGRGPFERETARQWAQIDLESVLWGLPLDDETWCRRRIEEVSREAVADAAERYLDPERLVETIGAPS